MRKKRIRKILAVLLSGALLCFPGCSESTQAAEKTGSKTETEEPEGYEDRELVTEQEDDTKSTDGKNEGTEEITDHKSSSGETSEGSSSEDEQPGRTGMEGTEGTEKNREETDAGADDTGKNTEEPPAEDGMETMIAEILSSLPLREKISLLLMPAMKSWKEGGIQPGNGGLSDRQLQLLREYHFGGIILFEENCGSAEQARAFTDAAQKANREGGACSGLIMATDQEGGYVTRLSTGTSMPGNMALGSTGDPENAKKAAAVIGEELRALGIHLDLAPCLDINNNPQNPVIGVRSFSDDPETVSAYGSAFIDGLHESGTAAALKHFPGHGDTASDSHSGLPRIDKTIEELREFELLPFAANAEKADAVMTAHISFPLIETETAVSVADGQKITLPATMSYTLITKVLRGELGFSGVVVTDALYMGAVASHFTPLDAGKRALLAGADLLLMPVELTDSEGISALSAYVGGLIRMVENGEIPMERIDESVTRILRLKAKYGLISAPAAPEETGDPEDGLSETAADPENPTPDLSCVGSYEHHEIEWEIALKAVTVVKNDDGLLPVSAFRKAVVACPYESQLLSVEYAKRRLQKDGVIGQDTEITAFCCQGLSADQAGNYLSDADLVIGIFSMYSLSELNTQTAAGQRAAFLDRLLSASHSAGVPFVFVSSQLPYDTEHFHSADAILCCYLAHGMTALPPESNDFSGIPEYGANLPAAIYRIFAEN